MDASLLAVLSSRLGCVLGLFSRLVSGGAKCALLRSKLLVALRDKIGFGLFGFVTRDREHITAASGTRCASAGDTHAVGDARGIQVFGCFLDGLQATFEKFGVVFVVGAHHLLNPRNVSGNTICS